MIRLRPFFIVVLFLAILSVQPTFAATTLPGAADLNRIVPTQPEPAPSPVVPSQNLQVPSAPLYSTPAPEKAKAIHFVLRGIAFKHVTVFSAEQLRDLYQPYVGKNVTLDVAWKIAAALTERYRQEGYFLSRAFVPAQKISKGSLILEIEGVEGYIGDVSLLGDAPASSLISSAIEGIKAGRPARLQSLERQLLLLNDLPGVSFQATLEPMHNPNEPAVRLILTARKTKGITTVSIDNGGSRYIGPFESSATWSGSLLPLQQTDLSVQYAPILKRVGGDLYSWNATQKMMLSTTTSLDVTGGYSTAFPGYTLKADDINSKSVTGGIGLGYNLIHQRQETLSTRLSVDFRNSASDILSTVLSRDRIRAANIGLNYDGTDAWLGDSRPASSSLALVFRHGLPVFNSNPVGDPEASRPDTSPDFTKLTANYSRLQSIAPDYVAALVLSGQKASGPLYSSEQFGYGGMAIGHAYDTSEISGDSGISGSLEVRYQGVPVIHQTIFMPYMFYDIGKVWNYSAGQPEQISAASAGLGIRLQCACGLSGNFYAAKPLTKPVSTPLYGDNDRAPRFGFQITDRF